jgi:hypothetical protein
MNRNHSFPKPPTERLIRQPRHKGIGRAKRKNRSTTTNLNHNTKETHHEAK